MKILLLGEYSGFFNSLKEGLTKLNHNVTLVGRKDNFKNYPVDISLEADFFNKKLPRFFRLGIHKIIKKDIATLETFFRFKYHQSKFKHYDVVLLINEQPVTKTPFLEKKILNFIFKNNKNVFLSACGDDYIFINSVLKDKKNYNILTPYHNNNKLKDRYKYSWVYTTKAAKKHHNFVFNYIKAVIPADFDYLAAYANHPKATALIPFPIRTHLLPFNPAKIEDKIVIFHGINKSNYYKKGNDIFDQALKIIKNKYASKVKIVTTVSLPYKEYINAYNNCHILLDQIYSYDQGYNALEAMAKGKVVFSGAEKQWLKYYNTKENAVVINATPSVTDIVNKLEWLILNPEKITEISLAARRFVEEHHNHIFIAQKYMDTLKAYL